MIPTWLANLLCYIAGPMLVIVIVSLVLTKLLDTL